MIKNSQKNGNREEPLQLNREHPQKSRTKILMVKDRMLPPETGNKATMC